MTSAASLRVSKRAIGFTLGLVLSVGSFSSGTPAQETSPQAASPQGLPQSQVQPPKKKAQSLDVQFVMLQNCLLGDTDVDRLKVGLLYGYSSGRASPYGGPPPPAPPPSTDYMESLQRDVDACQYAWHLKDSTARGQVLDLVRKDIRLKSVDCQMFGMSRKVPVRIMTIQSGAPVNGWTVYYKWSTISTLPVAEMSAAGLTSQATANLVPGVYTFRAELKVSDSETRKTISLTLPIGGQDKIEVQLPVQ